MRITPLDVRKQEFRRSVRGFDCDEVRAFLATLADEYETVLVDNKQIREQLIDQEDKISEYKTMERTLRDTLMTAEKLMQETKESAGREGDVIIQEAHQKAKAILEECRLRTEELRREIVGLRKEKETYLARFKGLAEAQIAFIESHKNDFADLDKRLVDLVDSVVEGSINSETEARLRTGISTGAAARKEQPAAAPLDTSSSAEPAGPAFPTAPAAQSHPEKDMWRDYNPGASRESTFDSAPPASQDHTPAPAPAAEQGPATVQDQAQAPAPAPAAEQGPATVQDQAQAPAMGPAPAPDGSQAPEAGPTAYPDAPTSEPEMLVNEVITETSQGEPANTAEEESEAIAEVISNSLSETEEKERQNQ